MAHDRDEQIGNGGKVGEWIYRKRSLIFCLTALLYLLAFNGQWRIGRDSALYRQLGHNLCTGKGYTYQGEQHYLAYPGLPCTLGGLEFIFGRSPWAPLLVMLAIAALTLVILYKMLLIDHPPWIAVTVTAITGLSGEFFMRASDILTDMPFLMGVMVCLYGLELSRVSMTFQRSAFAVFVATVGLTLSAWLRPTFWILALAVVTTGLWQLIRRPAWKHVALILCAVSVIFGRIYFHPGPDGVNLAAATHEGAELSRLKLLADGGSLLHLLKQNAPKVFEDEVPEAVFGLEIAPVANSFLVGLVIIGAFMLWRHRPVWSLLIFGILAVTLLGKPHARYYLMVQPLVIFGWIYLFRAVGAEIHPRYADRLMIVAILFLLLPNLGVSIQHVVRQRLTPFLKHYDHGSWVPVVEMSKLIHQHVPEGEGVIGPESRVMTFLSNRYVYDLEQILSKEPKRRWPSVLKRLAVNYAVLPFGPAYRRYPLAKKLYDRGTLVPGAVVAKTGNWQLTKIKLKGLPGEIAVPLCEPLPSERKRSRPQQTWQIVNDSGRGSSFLTPLEGLSKPSIGR